MEDAHKAYEETTKRGAKSYFEPKIHRDDSGEIVTSGIYTYGETVHVFVERKIIVCFSQDMLRGNPIIIHQVQG